MREKADRQSIEVRVLHKLTEALALAETMEEVFAFGLNAIQDILDPDHAFVLLAEPGLGGPPAPSRPECIPIRLGDELLGKFILRYGRRRGSAEHNLLIAELISVHVSLAIRCLREKNQLKQAIRERDELVAMAVHEIRSPLAAIIGGVFLLRRGRAPEVEHAIEIIDRSARSQGRLIEELLNLCQLDAGKAEFCFDNQNLVPVIQEVIDDIEPVALASKTSLRTEMPDPLIICGDAQRLSQIFSNLIANSVRFASPSGEVQIIATREDGSARICIKDNGVGIDPEQLPYVFDRFRQVHRPNSRTYDGVGLGLAIAKELVAMHGGSIAAESPGLGKGATFTVRLPFPS